MIHFLRIYCLTLLNVVLSVCLCMVGQWIASFRVVCMSSRLHVRKLTTLLTSTLTLRERITAHEGFRNTFHIVKTAKQQKCVTTDSTAQHRIFFMCTFLRNFVILSIPYEKHPHYTLVCLESGQYDTVVKKIKRHFFLARTGIGCDSFLRVLANRKSP